MPTICLFRDRLESTGTGPFPLADLRDVAASAVWRGLRSLGTEVLEVANDGRGGEPGILTRDDLASACARSEVDALMVFVQRPADLERHRSWLRELADVPLLAWIADATVRPNLPPSLASRVAAVCAPLSEIRHRLEIGNPGTPGLVVPLPAGPFVASARRSDGSVLVLADAPGEPTAEASGQPAGAGADRRRRPVPWSLLRRRIPELEAPGAAHAGDEMRDGASDRRGGGEDAEALPVTTDAELEQAVAAASFGLVPTGALEPARRGAIAAFYLVNGLVPVGPDAGRWTRLAVRWGVAAGALARSEPPSVAEREALARRSALSLDCAESGLRAAEALDALRDGLLQRPEAETDGEPAPWRMRIVERKVGDAVANALDALGTVTTDTIVDAVVEEKNRLIDTLSAELEKTRRELRASRQGKP